MLSVIMLLFQLFIGSLVKFLISRLAGNLGKISAIFLKASKSFRLTCITEFSRKSRGTLAFYFTHHIPANASIVAFCMITHIDLSFTERSFITIKTLAVISFFLVNAQSLIHARLQSTVIDLLLYCEINLN